MLISQTAGGTQQGTGGKAGNAQPALPFMRGTRAHTEKFYDKVIASTTSDQDLGSIDIPPYGYLRAIIIKLSTSVASVGTTFVYDEDAPFNILKNIMVTEPNGAPIHQFFSGFDLAMVNKYGAIRRRGDPRAMPSFVTCTGSTGGSPAFTLRIPFEIDERSGLGSLPNQNNSALYKLRMSIAGSGDWLTSSATFTQQPSWRIEAWTESWDQPAASTPLGPVQQTPPGLQTTQYWSQQVYPVLVGANTIKLNRMGLYHRNHIYIFRTATDRVTATTGGEATFPDEWKLFLDTLNVDNINSTLWKRRIYERYNFGAAGSTIDLINGLDSGVRPFDWCHEFDGAVGYENRDQWLYTLASQRFEWQFTASTAGALTVLTNDVSAVGNIWLG